MEESRAIVGRLSALHRMRRALSEGSPYRWKFARALLSRLAPYYLWISLRSAMQLAEVMILTAVHFIFFPPASLIFLRILYGLSLAATLLAMMLRSYLRGSSADPGRAAREVRICVAAITFLGALFAALAMVYLAVAGTLHLSAPPIYRALICGQVLALPFEAGLVVLMYGAGSIRPGFISPVGRALWLLPQIAALGALILNQPLLYLSLAVLGRAIPMVVIRNALLGKRGAARQRSSWSETRALLGRVVSPYLAGLGAFVAFELLFLAGTSSSVLPRENLGMVVLVIHKIAHIALSLSIRINFGFDARLTPERDDWRRAGLARRIVPAALGCAVLAMLQLPAFLGQLGWMMWLEPTGESYTVGPRALLAGVLLCLSYALLGGVLVLGRWGRHSLRSFAAVVLPACAAAALLFLRGRRWSLQWDAETVLFVFASAALLLLSLAVAILRHRSKWLPSARDPDLQLVGLLRDATEGRGTARAAPYLLRGEFNFDTDEAQAGGWARRVVGCGSSHALIPWGANGAILGQEAGPPRLRTIRTISHRLTGVQPAGVGAQLADDLFRLAYAELPAPFIADEAEAARLLVTNAASADSTRSAAQMLAARGFQVLELASGRWFGAEVESGSELCSKLEAAAAHILARGSYLDPAVWRHRPCRGIFHLNRGAVPALVVSAGEGPPNRIFYLRQQAFRANVTALLRHADPRTEVSA